MKRLPRRLWCGTCIRDLMNMPHTTMVVIMPEQGSVIETRLRGTELVDYLIKIRSGEYMVHDRNTDIRYAGGIPHDYPIHLVGETIVNGSLVCRYHA